MARPGYIEAKRALETARLDYQEALDCLKIEESLPADTEPARVLRDFRLGQAKEVHDRRLAVLDNAKLVWQAFGKEPKTRRGPRQYFASTRSIMLSATQPMLDAMDSHCASERISVPELIRRALAVYFKLGV